MCRGVGCRLGGARVELQSATYAAHQNSTCYDAGLHDESHELLGLQSTHTVVAHTTSSAQQSLSSARDTLEQDREQYRQRMAGARASKGRVPAPKRRRCMHRGTGRNVMGE